MTDENTLEVEIVKEIECSKEVALWNYWDHEHLDIVHDGYKQSDVLYDKKNFLFRVDQIKIPLLPFMKFMTPIFMVQDDDDNLLVYAIQMGVLSKTTITIISKSEKNCQITMNYKFYLNGWRKLLRPILKRLIPKWNERVWQEDVNLKLRRQKVKDMGFRDFVGLNEDREKRVSDNDEIKNITLPVPRPKNSTRDLHPFSIRNKNKI
jgi:hypothetical protein